MTKAHKTKGRVEEYDREIGIRLRALRKLHNYTQDVLAKKLDITFQQVQKYEQGTNRISAGKIKQILNIFEIPSSYFFEDNKTAKKIGFAENKQEPFDGPGAKKESKIDVFQTTETINLLRAYYSVKDAKARKGMYKMIKTYAENIENASKS